MTSTSEGPAAPTVGTGRPLLLIVDDESSVRGLLTLLLGQLGYATVSAADGAEGLALYRSRSGQIAGVLLDVRLRVGMGGLEVLAELRRADPGVRCCLMSGGSGEFTPEELEAFSGCPVLRKPFRLEAVRATLRQLVGSPSV